jgi:hypothetical protein
LQSGFGQSEKEFPRDRHHKSTRIKKCRKREKAGFVQDLGVLWGFRADSVQDYAHSTLFVPHCKRLQAGLFLKNRLKQSGCKESKRLIMAFQTRPGLCETILNLHF